MEAEKANRKIYLTWEAEEYDHIPKNGWWFIILVSVVVALVSTALILQNYFFAAFIVLAGIFIGWFGLNRPKRVRFAVTSQGVEVSGRVYTFEELRSFCILYDPPLFKDLSLESKKMFMPHIHVRLGETSPASVREALSKFIPEKKHEEPFIRILSRLLKF